MNLPFLRWGRLEEKFVEFGCGHVKFEVPMRHASGDIESSVNHMSLEFRGEVKIQNKNVGAKKKKCRSYQCLVTKVSEARWAPWRV